MVKAKLRSYALSHYNIFCLQPLKHKTTTYAEMKAVLLHGKPVQLYVN